MLLKNKFIIFFILILFITPLAYAQMCEVAHVRNNLRKMLYDYFESPSTATMELDKIKDLLDFYLTIPPTEDNIDCSGTGTNSGVSYQIIVEEADNITTAIPLCSDGTEFGTCSNNKPSYCYNGRLVNRCSTCNCTSGKECQSDGSCLEPTIACYNEADCEPAYGNYFCLTGDIYRNKTLYNCTNPGTASSECTIYTSFAELVDDCTADEYCVEG
ncbi:unnamed protein product, partial [marine sediment metagenome]